MTTVSETFVNIHGFLQFAFHNRQTQSYNNNFYYLIWKFTKINLMRDRKSNFWRKYKQWLNDTWKIFQTKVYLAPKHIALRIKIVTKSGIINQGKVLLFHRGELSAVYSRLINSYCEILYMRPTSLWYPIDMKWSFCFSKCRYINNRPIFARNYILHKI